MATNRSRKETLRLYRIRTHGAGISRTVSGFINKPAEYAHWHDDALETTGFSSTGFTKSSLGYLGPSPKQFLRDHGFAEDAEFIIADTYVPYDRTRFDLDALSAFIWVIVSGGTVITAVNIINNDEARTVSVTTPVNIETLEFYVNPQSINVVKRKLFQKLRTRGGWAFQHWGPDIGEIQLEGVTGNITPAQPSNVFADIPLPTETTSPAFQAFRLLETWYDDDQGETAQHDGILLALEFRGKIYVGHIKAFSYMEKGDKPFLLAYKLEFVVHYDSGSLVDAATRAQNRIIRNQQTLDYIASIKNSNTDTIDGPTG